MTEIEAKGFIQGKLDCMEKCDVFNREDKHRNNECDNCEYCYSQGNFGEQKEAFSIAINALEKQIPKKPKYEADGYADGELVYDYAKCPICGHDFEYGINDWGCEYCSDCGQKLNWESDEE